jgi:hypothetical protein
MLLIIYKPDSIAKFDKDYFRLCSKIIRKEETGCFGSWSHACMVVQYSVQDDNSSNVSAEACKLWSSVQLNWLTSKDETHTFIYVRIAENVASWSVLLQRRVLHTYVKYTLSVLTHNCPIFPPLTLTNSEVLPLQAQTTRSDVRMCRWRFKTTKLIWGADLFQTPHKWPQICRVIFHETVQRCLMYTQKWHAQKLSEILTNMMEWLHPVCNFYSDWKGAPSE